MKGDKSVTIRYSKEVDFNKKRPVEVISSKSFLHRALICAAMACGTSSISYKGLSDDIMATISALEVLGAKIDIGLTSLSVRPIEPEKRKFDYTCQMYSEDMKSDFHRGKNTIKRYDYDPKIVDCGESGSTLRMLLPLATSLTDDYIFVGKEGLKRRPISDLTRVLRQAGADVCQDTLPIEIRNKSTDASAFRDNNEMGTDTFKADSIGELTRKTYIDEKRTIFFIRGDISSQYISGLLLAGPLMDREVIVNVLDRLESKPYIDLTKDVMSIFGVKVEEFELSTNAFADNIVRSYKIKSGQKYKHVNINSQADWSNACFFMALGALKMPISIENLDFGSSQGDKKIVDVLKGYGAKILISNSKIEIWPNDRNAIDLDISDTPDILPILAVLAMFAHGDSIFTGFERLRIKESDRVESVIKMVQSLGGQARVKGDLFIVEGIEKYLNQESGRIYRVDSFNDHRIVMAASIASSMLNGDLVINGAEAVNKSYPGFFDLLEDLGFTVIK